MISSVVKTSFPLPSRPNLLADAVDCFVEPECLPEGEQDSESPAYLCSVRQAARIVGQKWTLQIVNVLMDFQELRFCELQLRLGKVNPSTLSARLKMLEEEGIVMRSAVSATPPHVTYRLTEMGDQLSGVIQELTNWSSKWLCEPVSSLDHAQLEDAE